MSRDLRLQVILSAVDKFTRPFRSAQTSNKKLAETLRQSRQQLKALNQQASQIDGFRKTKQQLESTKQAYQQASANVATLARAMSASTNPTKTQVRELERAKAAAAKLKNETGTLSQSLQRQRDSLKNNGISTRQLGSAQNRLTTDIANTTRRLREQEQQLKRIASQEKRMAAAKGRYQKTMDVRNKMAGGGAAATAAGVGVLYGAKRTLGAGFDFEKGMSGVQALTRLDKSAPEFKALTEQARELGATTSFTANDVAGGMGFLAMAGYDADKIQKSIPSMLDLAKAAKMDDALAEVSDIASNIQSAYKIPADEMKRVADALTFGFTTSNTDLRMLGETMKYVGPAAQAAGQDFESMVASVGLLGNVGIQSSMAGTSLKTALLRLAAPPKAAKKALDQLGMSIADSNGRMKEMPVILSELEKSFAKKGINGKGNVKKLAHIKNIFGIESSSAILELLDKQSEIDPSKRIEAYIEQIKGAKGTARKVAATMADNLDGDWRNAVSAFEDVAITIYDDIRDDLREITKEITTIIRKVGDWAKANPKIVKTIAAIAIGLGTVLTIGGGIALMIAAMLGPLAMAKLSLSVLGIKGGGFLSMLLSPLKLVGAAFMWLGKILLTNPIILIIAAIAGAAYLIYKYWDDIVPFFKALWESITKFFSAAWDNISKYTAEKWDAIKKSISGKWDEVINDIKAVGVKLKEIGGQIIDSLKEGIMEKWESLKSKFAEIKKMATDLIPDWMLSDETKNERTQAQIAVITGSMKSAGMFDNGGYIPRGQFGIAGENGPEVVNGPARVMSRRHTAALAAAALSFGSVNASADKPIHPFALPASHYQSASKTINQSQTQASSQAIEINIHATANQSAQDIAREVARQLAKLQQQEQSRRLSQYQDSEEF